MLDGPEGRHAATVKRLRPGETVLLGDGRGGLAHAVVLAIGRDVVECAITDRSTVPPPSPRIVLAQALVKGDRGELAVELATEAGVDAIVPWTAARCVARWAEGRGVPRASARWRTTVREAAKQARRPWVPSVAEPASTRALAARVAAAACALVLHEGAALTLADLPLAATGAGAAGPPAARRPATSRRRCGARRRPIGGRPTVCRRGPAARRPATSRRGWWFCCPVVRRRRRGAARRPAAAGVASGLRPPGRRRDPAHRRTRGWDHRRRAGGADAGGRDGRPPRARGAAASTAAAVALGALGVLTGRWAPRPTPTAASAG